MSDYTVNIDYSNLLMGMSEINQAIDAQVQYTVSMAAQKVHEEWGQRVRMAKGIRFEERNAYRASLKWDNTGKYSACVWTDLKVAEDIETGRPAYDMKRMLQTSSKVRQGKKGKYLIIPMRHNTPGNTAHAGDMPSNVHAAARQLPLSKVTGHKWQSNGLGGGGIYVQRATYEWGGRLPAGMAPKLKPHHTTDIYAGMVRFDTSTGKSKSSQYLTFRILGDWQDGKWIIPAKPGLYIARQLATDIQSEVEGIFSTSLSST